MPPQAKRRGGRRQPAWKARQGSTQALVGFAAGVMPVPRATPFTLISADYHGKLSWWQGADEAPKPLKTVAAHKGYGTAAHLAALDEHGPCDWHRRSFEPVRLAALRRTCVE